MIFVVFCQDVPGGTEKRAALGKAHMAHIKATRPHYLAAGPCPANAARSEQASLLLVEAADEAAARALIEQDPFFIGGVWKDVVIRPFRPVVGRWLPAGMEVDLDRY